VVCKCTWTQDHFPWWTFLPAFFQSEDLWVSLFVYVSWLSSQSFDEKREKWWQNGSVSSFAKQIEMEVLAISSAVCGYHVYKDIWKTSSATNSPTKGSSIITYCFAIKVFNNRETVGHLPGEFQTLYRTCGVQNNSLACNNQFMLYCVFCDKSPSDLQFEQ